MTSLLLDERLEVTKGVNIMKAVLQGFFHTYLEILKPIYEYNLIFLNLPIHRDLDPKCLLIQLLLKNEYAKLFRTLEYFLFQKI